MSDTNELHERDDSLLYTGMTSAVSRRVEAGKVERRYEDTNVRVQLSPSQELIAELIDKERADIMNISSLQVSANTDLLDLKADLIARKLYVAYLGKFQKKLNRILNPRETKEQES